MNKKSNLPDTCAIVLEPLASGLEALAQDGAREHFPSLTLGKLLKKVQFDRFAEQYGAENSFADADVLTRGMENVGTRIKKWENRCRDHRISPEILTSPLDENSTNYDWREVVSLRGDWDDIAELIIKEARKIRALSRVFHEKMEADKISKKRSGDYDAAPDQWGTPGRMCQLGKVLRDAGREMTTAELRRKGVDPGTVCAPSKGCTAMEKAWSDSHLRAGRGRWKWNPPSLPSGK